MNTQKKAWYMAIGGLLALAIVFGAAFTFAQSDESEPVVAAPALQADEGDGDVVPPFPGRGGPGRRGPGEPIGFGRPDNELLAELLGISAEELEAAYRAAHTAAVEQALADELITPEQAEQLLSGENGFRGRFGGGFFGGLDHEGFLAEALGISVEELQAARDELKDARLAEMIDAGVLTQEQADLMAARQAVAGYIDREALAETMLAAYEAAVEQALADGAINQSQADQLLENPSGFGPFGDGGGFPGGMRGHHGSGPRGGGFRGGPNGGQFPGANRPAGFGPGSNA